MTENSEIYSAYIRRSTFQQENEHQMQAIRDWLEEKSIDPSEVDFYQETASGASRNREELQKVMEAIDAGEIKHLVIWELSRIAREGKLAQEFFDLCEENNVTVHITSGSLRRIEPDGSNRFVADILAAVYAEERRSLIRRTHYGLERAKNNDKWVGQPPLGFTTDDDGYLIPNLGYNEERDSFIAIRDALERLEDGESFRSVASELKASRHGITRLYKDEEKKKRYLELEADDKRVDVALDEIRKHALCELRAMDGGDAPDVV